MWYYDNIANMMTQNKTMLHAAARQAVVGVLRELFSDPDAGFSLRGTAARRLKQSVRSKETGAAKDLRDVLKRL